MARILGLLLLTVFIPLGYAVDPNIHCVEDAVDGPKTTGNLACYDSDGVIRKPTASRRHLRFYQHELISYLLKSPAMHV